MARTKRKSVGTLKKDVLEDIKNNPDKYKGLEAKENKDSLFKQLSTPRCKKALAKFKKIYDSPAYKNIEAAMAVNMQTGISYNVIFRVATEVINPLEVNLSEGQKKVVYDFMNTILLQTPLSYEELDDAFMLRKRNTKYPIRNIAKLAAMLKALAYDGYITKGWQNIVSKNKIFSSKHGRVVKDSAFSNSLYNSYCFRKAADDYPEIIELIEEIKSTLVSGEIFP